MKITSWSLHIEWDDGTKETVDRTPDWVAAHIDDFLNELEEESDDAEKS